MSANEPKANILGTWAPTRSRRASWDCYQMRSGVRCRITAPQITRTIIAPTTAPIRPAPSPGAIPSQGLTQPRSNERTHNSKYGCQDGSRGFIAAWRNQLRDHARDEPDDDGPGTMPTGLSYSSGSSSTTPRVAALTSYESESSTSVGSRPCGVYLSTASGSSRQSLESRSSRAKPVCFDRVSSTSGPIACSSWAGVNCLLGPVLCRTSRFRSGRSA